MNEVIGFIAGCLFYSFRNWFGKQLWGAFMWCLKKALRMSEDEVSHYHKTKEARLATRLNTSRDD